MIGDFTRKTTKCQAQQDDCMKVLNERKLQDTSHIPTTCKNKASNYLWGLDSYCLILTMLGPEITTIYQL